MPCLCVYTALIIIVHNYYRELEDITSTCKIYEVPRDMLIVEFVTRTRDLKDNYEIISGCGYYEFTKKEYIPPESQVILMDKVCNIATKVHVDINFHVTYDVVDHAQSHFQS